MIIKWAGLKAFIRVASLTCQIITSLHLNLDFFFTKLV